MTGKNKYFARSRISEAKFREIAKCFAADLTAVQTAEMSGLNRNTINNIMKKLRLRIARFCERESCFEAGEVELDESRLGAGGNGGTRGRGARGKTIVFGLKKRDGKVHTQIVKNCSKNEILPLIRGKIPLGSTLFTDGFKTCDGLVDMGCKKHHRVLHGKNEFAKSEGKLRNHINGIENFRGLAKVRLVKFRGMSKNTFYLHLKECEFRFNHRKRNLYELVLDIVRNDPLG